MTAPKMSDVFRLFGVATLVIALVGALAFRQDPLTTADTLLVSIAAGVLSLSIQGRER